MTFYGEMRLSNTECQDVSFLRKNIYREEINVFLCGKKSICDILCSERKGMNLIKLWK